MASQALNTNHAAPRTTCHSHIGFDRQTQAKRTSGRRGFERLVPGLKETVQVMRQGESARERRTPQEAPFRRREAHAEEDRQSPRARVASTMSPSCKGRSSRSARDAHACHTRAHGTGARISERVHMVSFAGSRQATGVWDEPRCMFKMNMARPLAQKSQGAGLKRWGVRRTSRGAARTSITLAAGRCSLLCVDAKRA